MSDNDNYCVTTADEVHGKLKNIYNVRSPYMVIICLRFVRIAESGVINGNVTSLEIS